MRQARMPIEDFDIFALMAKAMSMQPLGHEAMELRAPNALSAEPANEASRKHRDPADGAPEGEREEPKRGLLDRIDHWFWTLEQRALEERLAKATDIYDLELRIREIERGAPWWPH